MAYICVRRDRMHYCGTSHLTTEKAEEHAARLNRKHKKLGFRGVWWDVHSAAPGRML